MCTCEIENLELKERIKNMNRLNFDNISNELKKY